MKKIILLTAFFALMIGFKAEAKSPAPFEFGIFYSSLSPHGSWLELESGFVVWRPTIMKRWAPYQSGRWIWTESGWYWDSYEPFGHITYHYGRWYYDDYYGWIWIPDYEWAPAWVEWRYDDDYIGWAPLPPYATFSVNIGIVFTNNYHTPYNYWHFVNYDRFCDPYPYNYYVPEKHKYRIHGRTKYRSDYTFRNGGVYNNGVDYDFVKQRSGRDIEQRELYRTNDERELRNRNGRNDDKIRTFAASREDLRKDSDGFRNAKIERSDRKSSLLTSKVELGDRTGRRNDDERKEPAVNNRNGSVTKNTRDQNVRQQDPNDRKKETVPLKRSGQDNMKTEQLRKQDDRNQNNNERLNTNQNRQKVELNRQKTEQLRKQDDRNQNNNERLNTNQNRQKVELNRQKTEVERKQNTDVRKQSGNTRIQTEQKRSNTDVRKQSGNTRIQTDQKRQNMEMNRQKNAELEKRQNTQMNQKKEVQRQDTRKQQSFGNQNKTDRTPKREVEVNRNKGTRETVKQNPVERNNDRQKTDRETGQKKRR